MELDKFVIIIEIKQTSFNLFLATREQTSQASEIRFSVVKVIDSFNKGNVLYSEARNELSSLKNNDKRRAVQSISGAGFDSRPISTRSRQEHADNKGIGKNILLHILRQEIFYPT